jgi:hypothetical protein
MTMKSENPSSEKSIPGGMSTSLGEGRQKISPAERWLLITEKAYHRIQRRGFVGGDPLEDWSEAEREVDAIYDTDTRHDFLRADAEKLTEQVKSAFGGYGLGHLSLDAILQKHREGLERLTEHNRRLIDNTSELAAQQTALFQDAVGEALETLRLFTQGKVSTGGFEKQAELSTRAMENVLSYFKDLTQSVTDVSPLSNQSEAEKSSKHHEK